MREAECRNLYGVRLLCGAARSGSRVTVPEEEVVVPQLYPQPEEAVVDAQP